MGSFQQAAIEEGANRVIMILNLYYQGFSVKKIASKVGCSESVVKRCLSRFKGPTPQAVAPSVP